MAAAPLLGLLLRQVREQLAAWETGLIETARDAGASWADLAHNDPAHLIHPLNATRPHLTTTHR